MLKTLVSPALRLSFLLLVSLASTLTASPLAAQGESGGFIYRLGTDTVAIESYTRAGLVINGTIVRRLPRANVLRYTLTLNADNSVASYTQQAVSPDGTPAPNAPTGLGMTFTADSVIRTTVQNNAPVTLRAAAPAGTIPNLAYSAVMTALQVQTMRRVGTVYGIGLGANQVAPAKLDIRLIGADSAESVAAGFRTGYKVDARGKLLRHDGSLTTQKFVGTPVDALDATAIATAWTARDAAGAAPGAASTRDTVNATIANATLWIDYGRPAMRGREIWGKLVPFDTTWRLGANAATQFRTDKELEINGAIVPAGFYTLWLLPTAQGATLIVNSQTGQWGTAYDATRDVVRIPLGARRTLAVSEERFKISVAGETLMFQWDTGAYSARIRVK